MTIKDLARKVALTALASIYGSSGIMAIADNDHKISAEDNEDRFNIQTNKPNLILKKPALDMDRYKDNPESHRSHRSHSSHRSHYSSHNSGHLSHYSSYSGSNSNSSSSKSKSSSSNSIYTPYTPSKPNYSPPPTTTNSLYEITYSMGDRTLRKGMSGNDVKELKEFLIKYGYLQSSSIFGVTNDFDYQTKQAIIKFQKAKNISADGIVGQTSFYYINTHIAPTPSISYPSIGNIIDKISTEDEINIVQDDDEEGKVYTVEQNTSLRQSPTSKAKVLKRVQTGETVIVLNSKQSKFWWKVSCNGNIGWIKSALLK
jgi:peptidoglycan hydrolase-like protein with peptidoglycan-binding domain